MASRPTIYKLQISVSDLDRHYYDTLNLTLAQHPAERAHDGSGAGVLFER